MASTTTGQSSSGKSRFMPRFQLGWSRFIPFIGYHHVLMALIVVALVLQSILVAGCTSENLNGIYLFSLTYTDAGASAHETGPAEVNANASSVIASLAGNGTQLEVRSGYFGMCLWTSAAAAAGWICSRSPARLASIVEPSEAGSMGDPLNLIYAAEKFKSEVVFVGLIFISIALSIIAMLLLATFPGWHEEENSEGSAMDVKPFPSRPVSRVALGCTTASAIVALLASFWQHMAGAAASAMAAAFTYGAAKGGIGAGAIVCGWLSFVLLMIVALGLVIMILSIKVLDRLT